MRAESSPIGSLEDQDSSSDEERWGPTKPPVSLKPHRRQGPRPWEPPGTGGLPLAPLPSSCWASACGLPAPCLASLPHRKYQFPLCQTGRLFSPSFSAHNLNRSKVSCRCCSGGRPGAAPAAARYWGWVGRALSPGTARRRGRDAGLGVSSFLAPGMASSPLAAPSGAGRTGLAGLDAASMFFPRSGLGLTMSRTSRTSPELLSKGFRAQIGEGSSSPARPGGSAWPPSRGDGGAGCPGRQSRHGWCRAGCGGAAPGPGGELWVKRREMLSQTRGGGEASPTVPRRAGGLRSGMEEQGVRKRFWGGQFAGAAMVWCVGLEVLLRVEVLRERRRRRRVLLAGQGWGPGTLLLAGCLLKQRGFALPLSSCPGGCAGAGTAVSLASGGQVPLRLPTLCGCRAWSHARCLGAPCPPLPPPLPGRCQGRCARSSSTDPSRLPPAWHRPCPLPRCQPPGLP